MELNKIYNMDCIEGLKRIPNDFVDLVLTDIPYDGVNRESHGLRELDKGDADVITFDLKHLMNELVRVCKGSIYVFCGIGQISDIYKVFNDKGLSTRLLIWEKTNPSPMNGEHFWLSGIEPCVVGRKKNSTFNRMCKNSVFKFQSKKSDMTEEIEHPTTKPIKLFREFVEASSKENDIVLDVCMGSGTTAVACKQLNRRYIGFEISGEYCEIAHRRLQQSNLNSFFG